MCVWRRFRGASSRVKTSLRRGLGCASPLVCRAVGQNQPATVQAHRTVPLGRPQAGARGVGDPAGPAPPRAPDRPASAPPSSGTHAAGKHSTGTADPAPRQEHDTATTRASAIHDLIQSFGHLTPSRPPRRDRRSEPIGHEERVDKRLPKRFRFLLRAERNRRATHRPSGLLVAIHPASESLSIAVLPLRLYSRSLPIGTRVLAVVELALFGVELNLFAGAHAHENRAPPCR